MAKRIPESKNRAVHPGLLGSWTKNREVTKSYSSTFKSHAHSYGFKARLNHWLNGEAMNPKTAKTLGILFLIVSLGLGGLGWYSQPGNGLFHNYVSTGQDPYTNLYQSKLTQCLNNGAASEFSSQNAVCVAAGTNQCLNSFAASCLETKPGTNGLPSITLTKSPVDLGTVAGKELGFQIAWGITPLNGVAHWIEYLTSNTTLPANQFTTGPSIQMNTATAQTFSLILRTDTNGQISKTSTVFPIAAPFDVANINFNLERTGNPTGNLFAEVYSISGVLPNGTPNVLLATSRPLNVAGISSSSVQFTSFTFDGPFFVGTAGSNYFAVLDASQLTTTAGDYVTTNLQNIVGSQNKADFAVGGSWTADNLHTLDYAVFGFEYYPTYDPNVALAIEINASGGTATYTVWMQKKAGESIQAENIGCISGGGSCFGQQSSSVALNQNPASVLLNYTGSDNSNHQGNSGIVSEFANGTTAWNILSSTFPWMPLNVPYYVGFWENTESTQNVDIEGTSGTAACLVASNVQPPTTCFTIVSATPSTVGTATVVPQVDTGGFFGPVIKALINIGVFILGAVLTFVGYIANLIINAMNVVGNFLGIGPMGTDMVNLFATILGFVSNVFTNFFTWAANSATLIGNAFTSLGKLLGTYFTQIGAFFSGLVGFAGFLWTVIAAFLQFGSYPTAFAITAWWTWGMFSAYDGGLEGFLGWVDSSEAIMFKGLNVVIWFGEETFKAIARLRTILPRPAGI